MKRKQQSQPAEETYKQEEKKKIKTGLCSQQNNSMILIGNLTRDDDGRIQN